MLIRRRKFFLGTLLAVCASILVYALNKPSVVQAKPVDMTFPSDFLWGTATAAYQVEGGNHNDWSEAGWDAGKATESYTRYPEDFKLAQGLGTNGHRMSLEWSRIEPEKGKWNMAEVEHYRQVLKSMKAHGLKPMVTLHHFTNPVWIAKLGGWSNDEIVPLYTRYVAFIVNELKDEADTWVTVNEPVVSAFKSYDSGEWPPHLKDREKALHVIKNYILAHGKAYRAIHAVQLGAKVGFAKHVTLLEPNWWLNPMDHLVAGFQSSLFNKAFWDTLVSGELRLEIPGVPSIIIPYDKDLQGTMDFIGINYYTRWLVQADGSHLTRPEAEKSALNWEVYPEGMLEMLKLTGEYANKLKIPIYITENGIDDPDDHQRPRYILTHLRKVWEAIQMGIPVKGYMYWALMDNFEWTERYKSKFGLFTIDRKPRPSADLYREICTHNGISVALWKKYIPEE